MPTRETRPASAFLMPAEIWAASWGYRADVQIPWSAAGVAVALGGGGGAGERDAFRRAGVLRRAGADRVADASRRGGADWPQPVTAMAAATTPAPSRTANRHLGRDLENLTGTVCPKDRGWTSRVAASTAEAAEADAAAVSAGSATQATHPR